MNDMDLFYSEHESTLTPVGLLERGCLYASQIDGIWARVELIAYTESGDVNVHFFFLFPEKHYITSQTFFLNR